MAKKDRNVKSFPFDHQQLIADKSVRTIVADAKKSFAARQISNIVDDENLQYVDLVMEGGGVWGFALLGYTYLLEEMGIRFLSIGGASAGAITAVLMAGLDEPAKPKSAKILAVLGAKDPYDFIDGDGDARRFLAAVIDKKSKFQKLWSLAQIRDNLSQDLGLNPGENLRRWLQSALAEYGVNTLADLERRMRTRPKGLRHRGGAEISDEKMSRTRLRIVAADVTTETKVVFPEMADLYFDDPASVCPAEFVRASMSIPFFFTPYVREPLPRTPSLVRRWLDATGIRFTSATEIPDKALFVDGGIVSNFPIDLFHDYSKMPSAPTFGVKLGHDDRRHEIGGPIQLFQAIFNAARHCLDYDFISKNPDYRQLVTCVPLAKDLGWLDFKMSSSDKQRLFRAGALAAAEFLRDFDWEKYQETRAGMMRTTEAAEPQPAAVSEAA